MSTTKVTLRKREYPSGKIALYLDFYPAIRNPRTHAMTRREYLGIYLLKNPRSPQERTENSEKLTRAKAIRSDRELSIINEQYGFIDKKKGKMDALDYFKTIILAEHERWYPVYIHLSRFCQNSLTFGEITEDFCNEFKEYLLNIKQLRDETTPLNQNTIAGYWIKFRALLKIAYKERYLDEDINNRLEYMEFKQTRREYLSIDEVNTLAKSNCKSPVLKAASLFSCLTGLRMSDISQLTWENIHDYPGGGKCIRICTEKTEEEATLPISEEAYKWCGTPGTGQVFKRFNRSTVQNYLRDWLDSCGISKKITFHCFRHTYATLLIAGGADIYTVSKMLTHKNVTTTQIYADLVNEKKKAASEIIKLDD